MQCLDAMVFKLQCLYDENIDGDTFLASMNFQTSQEQYYEQQNTGP
jgi:hypothetical protein